MIELVTFMVPSHAKSLRCQVLLLIEKNLFIMKIKCQEKEKHFFFSPDIFCSLDNSVVCPISSQGIFGNVWRHLSLSQLRCMCVCVCVYVSYQHVVNGNLVSWQTLCNARDHSTTPSPAVNYGTPNVNRAEVEKT